MSIHRPYLLFILFTTLMFNKVEHSALGVMLQTIKSDLRLSDTELGLLTGIAFAIFYASVGLPIARWADRGDRITVIALTTALQGGALALSGLTGSFLQLLAVRVGVAVGEAGAVAPANSLIADAFAPNERSGATAWFMLGYPASAVAGYFLGGWLNDLVGWRATFLFLGLPGLAVAALARLTLKDPRIGKKRAETSAVVMPSVREVAASLLANRTYRNLVIGYSLVTFFAIGVIQWLPTFFIRTYGFSTSRLGLWLAVIWGLGGVLGTIAAATFASRRAGREADLIGALAAVFCAAGVLAAGIYLSPSAYLGFALLVPIAAVNYGTAGPLFATVQTLVPERMRAVAIAVTYLCTNLIGVGLGPLAVGALSDAFTPSLGADALRYALLALCPGYLWAAWHMWRARLTVSDDLAAARGSEGSMALTPALQEP